MQRLSKNLQLPLPLSKDCAVGKSAPGGLQCVMKAVLTDDKHIVVFDRETLKSKNAQLASNFVVRAASAGHESSLDDTCQNALFTNFQC